MPPAFTDVRETLPLSPYFRGANPNSRRAISWNSFERLGNVAAVTVFRHVTFQMAEVAVPSQLFGEILRLIDGLRPRPRPAPT